VAALLMLDAGDSRIAPFLVPQPWLAELSWKGKRSEPPAGIEAATCCLENDGSIRPPGPRAR
jgi:hypothetical protein